MTYKEALERFTLYDLKDIVRKILGTLQPEGTKKKDYIDHLLKYTNFDMETKVITTKKNVIRTTREERIERKERFDEKGTGLEMRRIKRRIIPLEGQEENKRITKRLITVVKSDITQEKVTFNRLGKTVQKMINTAKLINEDNSYDTKIDKEELQKVKDFFDQKVDIDDKLNNNGDTLKELGQTNKIKLYSTKTDPKKKYPLYIVYDPNYKDKEIFPYQYFKSKTYAKKEYDFPVFILSSPKSNKYMRNSVKFLPAEYSATDYQISKPIDEKSVFQILFEDGKSGKIHYTHSGHINTIGDEDSLYIHFVDIPVDFQGYGLSIILFLGLVGYASINSQLKDVKTIYLAYGATDVGGIVSYNTGCESAGFYNPIYHRLCNKFPGDTEEENIINRACAHSMAWKFENFDIKDKNNKNIGKTDDYMNAIYYDEKKNLLVLDDPISDIIKQLEEFKKNDEKEKAIKLNNTFKYFLIGNVIFEISFAKLFEIASTYNFGWKNIKYEPDILDLKKYISNYGKDVVEKLRENGKYKL